MRDVFEERREEARRQDEQRAAAVAFFGASYTKSMPLPKTKGIRPLCACCGKRYGERKLGYESKQFAIGTAIPRYQGNLFVVYEAVSVGTMMGPDHSPGATLTRHTWDGVSYRSRSRTDPFCSAACTLTFAQAAHRAGYRINNKTGQ